MKDNYRYQDFKEFPIEHFTINTDIIRYWLLSNSTALKICYQKYEHVESKNK